jgi:hypothetical protein
VAPTHAFSVAKGCSTVCRRSRDASGVLSRRRCIASSTCSCSQRVMRRKSAGVHCPCSGHFGQAEAQYLWELEPAFNGSEPPDSPLAGRAAVFVSFGVVHEVTLVKASLGSAA